MYKVLGIVSTQLVYARCFTYILSEACYYYKVLDFPTQTFLYSKFILVPFFWLPASSRTVCFI